MSAPGGDRVDRAAPGLRFARQIVVAGLAGGVGTTTVTALLFSALEAGPAGAPTLLDHSGGDLGARLAEGDEAARVDPALALHDLGAHAFGGAVDRLADHTVLLVAVTPATPLGLGLAEEWLDLVQRHRGPYGLWRTSLVCAEVFGRHRVRRPADRLRRRLGWRRVVVLPRDPSLAAGGRIPLSRIRRPSRRAIGELTSVVRNRLEPEAATN